MRPVQWNLWNVAERRFKRPKKMASLPCSWIRRLGIIKMAILHKMVYKTSSQDRIWACLFVEYDELALKLYGTAEERAWLNNSEKEHGQSAWTPWLQELL